MVIKRRLLVGVSGCLIVGLIFIQSTTKENKISYATFQTQSGWGYNIMAENKIVIHQENIPSLAVDKSFSTQQQANKAAEIVSKKLASGKIPSLTVQEVKSILEEK